MTRFYNYINEQEKLDWSDYINKISELKPALEIMKKIEDLGYEALIVGGFVRDVILGIPSDDLDITTNMPQDEIEKYFNTYDIGNNKSFGVSVVKYKGFDFEISNYRADIYSDLENGKGAETVQLVKSFKDDAARRDFTLNSLGINYNGYVVDHHGGTNDIKNKKITTVGDPKLRFTEDAVRMLRGVRFSSKLGFEIDDKSKDTIKSMASDISKISPERIRKELVKMAGQTGSKFADAIVTMDELGILEIILPEITKLKEFKENPEFHPEAYEHGEGRVFDHVLQALRQNKLADPIINFSILMHDLGKGLGYDGGKHRFFGHAEKAKELIDNISKRLKLTNKEKDAIMFSALNHMKMSNALDMKPTKILNLVSNEFWGVLKAVSYADDAARKGLFDKKRFDHIINNMEKIGKKYGDKVTNKTAKIVDGQRVMKITGIKSGPMVGKIISKVTDYVVNQGSKEPMDNLIRKAYKEIK